MKNPKPYTYAKELKVAKKIAKKAGKIMLKYFDADQSVEVKADKSVVTIADKLINDMTIKELAKAFPNDGVIGEEQSTSTYGMGRKWFCDPIDGTSGYVWGTPTAMFSLGLVIDGVPVFGAAHDPFLDRFYYGIKGKGSYCNGKKLQVSDKDIDGSYFAASGSVKHLITRKYIPVLRDLGVRFACFSGAVNKSCLIAKGKFVAYVEEGVNAHDVAAVHVIVEEAGGKVTDTKGGQLDYSKPVKGAVVTNGRVHDRILQIINSTT